MKIGTVTFWHSKENYGAMLQCYALVKFLNKKGHDARVLRIKAETGKDLKHPMLFRVINLVYALFRPGFFRKLRTKTSAKPCVKVVERGFDDFLEKNIPTFPYIYTFEEIDKEPVDVEALICGSDQVWSGVTRTYFLQMSGDYKRISYAPSFGGTRYENPIVRRMISKWLKKFDLVTVREQEGIDICQTMGIKALLVPDPTMLLDKDDYVELSENVPTETRPYIFLYLLGKEITIEVQEIFNFAQRNNYSIKYVASQGREDVFEKLYPSVEEWIGLIRDAKYVITNSFHGTVFSMIFGKPFITFPIVGDSKKMNGRIETLLGKFSMRERMFDNNLDVLFDPIDFSEFNIKIQNERDEISELLGQYLR